MVTATPWRAARRTAETFFWEMRCPIPMSVSSRSMTNSFEKSCLFVENILRFRDHVHPCSPPDERYFETTCIIELGTVCARFLLPGCFDQLAIMCNPCITGAANIDVETSLS